MKKLLATIICAVCIISMCSCGNTFKKTLITDAKMYSSMWSLPERRASERSDLFPSDVDTVDVSSFKCFHEVLFPLGMLYRIAYNILHDREDCEECKNDTYLGVWNAIPPTRPTVFPAFITQIMRNIATKKFKAKTRNKRIPTELTVSTDELVNSLHDDMTPESEYSANELGRLINEYVRSLTERQQYIFIGRYYLAETIEYLSSVLNVGVATVHRDLEKIKKGLKAYLEMNGVYV